MQNQEKLSNLSIISIEHEVANQRYNGKIRMEFYTTH